VALAVARQLVLFLRRPGGQSQFSRLLEAQASTQGSLGEVLVWAVENLDKDLSVENLALHAAMSRKIGLARSPHHTRRRQLLITGLMAFNIEGSASM
jgi:transcriptional regulator GlxA family with amidase domain